MGYDDKGNLVGIGEEAGSSIVACALLAGSSSMVTLGGCCNGPITIDFPGSTTWDGKYLAIGAESIHSNFRERPDSSDPFRNDVNVSGLTTLSDNCTAPTPTPLSVYRREENTPVIVSKVRPSSAPISGATTRALRRQLVALPGGRRSTQNAGAMPANPTARPSA